MSLSRTWLALVAVAGGCIAAPDEAPRMCEVQDDCREGTTCTDGFCYGDPPRTISLAGVLSTSDGSELTDLANLEVVDDGEITNLRFAPSVRVFGKVTFDTLPLGADIEVRRPSVITGFGDLIAHIEVKPDSDPITPDFEVRLQPRTSYEVTITPHDSPLGPDMPSAAEVAPARYFTFAVGESDLEVDWSLKPEGGLRQLTGIIADSTGEPVAGARVVAMGGPRALRDRPSTVATTGATGRFNVFASREFDPQFDLSVTIEPAPGTALKLVRRAVAVEDQPGVPVPYDIGTTNLPGYAAVDTFVFQVVGQATYGGTEPAAGADVLFRTSLDSPYEVAYEAHATANTEGTAELRLIPDRDYVVDVVPPAESPHGIVFGRSLRIGVGGVAAPIELPRRVFVSGEIVDADGEPVGDLEMEARLSFPYLMSLLPEQRALVEGRVWKATEVADGRYGVYVDPALFDTTAWYDLSVTPPQASFLPSWQFDQVVDFNADLPVMNAVELHPLALPPPSVVRGMVYDAGADPVMDAHLEVFVLTDTTICLSLQGECRPRPRRLALGVSDGEGWIEGLILPNPDPDAH